MLKAHKHSIRKELLQTILFIVVITTIVGYGIFIKAYTEYEQKKDIALLETISHVIAQDVAKIIYANDISVASDVTTQLQSFLNLDEVMLYNRNGEALFQYSKGNTTETSDIFKKDMLGKVTFKDGKLQLYGKLFYKGTFLAYGKYIFTTESIKDIFLDSISSFGLIVTIMLFVAFMLSRYQAKKFTTPILTLVKFFEDIKDKSFMHHRVRTKEKNEFGILYGKINVMLQTIENSLSHDHLTGIYNRSSLSNHIGKLQNNEIIMLIDISRFKEINDIYGNSYGNKVLIEFTQSLQQFFKKISSITLYRIGGDEFAVLLANKPMNEVMHIGENLEAYIREKDFQIDGIIINISVNIAVNNISPLLENADLAIKALKKDMDNQVIEYQEKLSIKREWQKNIEVINMVKSALKEDRIVPYFQGIVNLKTMQIEKYEALVRLILPSGEVLSPYLFLDTVSKTHYYYEITEVMIQKTMQMAKRYPHCRFSINFSMKDIINQHITSLLFGLFDMDKETASRVDIELLETESVIVNDNLIDDFLKKVHSYGSKVLIDDFGTGYSNFAYLSDLDVDILKIDASITKEITSSARKLHILQTIHNFSLGMNMQNVAEFVETKEVAELLQKIGVDYAQGYLFSKPLPQPLENADIILDM